MDIDDRARIILAPLVKSIEMHKAGLMDEPTLMFMCLQTMAEFDREGIRPDSELSGPVAHYLALLEAPVA